MHSFFLNHPSPSVLIPALRTVGNIVTGDDMQTQVVIAADIIGPLVHLLQTAEFDIKKEAAWALSSATYGGDPNQIKLKDITLNYPKESAERTDASNLAKPPWDLEVGKNFIIHYTYGCDYSLKGKLTYGKFGEWRFDKRSYLRGPPPRNLSLPPPGVPESVRVPQRNFVRHMSPSIAPFVSSQPVRPFVNPSGFPQVYLE
ncbi:hypothetical protein IFM89_025516 [Coptis chinensis]|uniref:Hydroxyproline O-arabinosyltransferase-like domain-containing protein n=1 Tax=Coptis chinensis TaxID=261450 RepID=A0A835H8S6_9MAGN|nr:hypothetical protein IFM89_025516 [Coptis chinensis]